MVVGGSCDDRASHVSLCVIVAGIVLVIIGCLWPLEPNYVIDPELTAAENETLQEDYTWRRNTLFLLAAVGMACLVTGGIITSVLVIRVMCLEESDEETGRQTEWPFPLPQQDSDKSGHGLTSTGSPHPSQSTAVDHDRLLEADFLQGKTTHYGSTEH